MKKKSVKRVLSLFVSILMTLGLIWQTPVAASAADFSSIGGACAPPAI